MVSTSLPFWMQNSGRTMSPFSFDATRFDGPAAAGRPPAPGTGGPARTPATGEIIVDLCSGEEIDDIEGEWRSLAARALEPNVFIEPGFALPAVRHFAPNQRPLFLLVWATVGDERAVLIGLCAVCALRHGYGPNITAAWIHDQAVMGAPLLDRVRAADALTAILDWLAARSADWRGLLLTGIAVDGPLMRVLAGSDRITVAEIDRKSRAVLRHAEPRAALVAALPPKRAKELRRQRRRLADQGDCGLTSARDVRDVKAATERFLDLESRGWKGRTGTALLRDPALAAFTRAMTRRLAQEGRCRIESLTVDGRPAAMGIVLSSGDRAYFWKTAYDETRRQQSPGKQFALALGEALLADTGIALTDSCAVPDHPMIDRLWGDRMIVADMLIAGRATPASHVARAARAVGLWRTCRFGVKRMRDLVRGAIARR